MGSQIRPKQAVRQFAPSLTKKKATNLKRKNPTRFSLYQKKQIVDLHHKKVSNLCHFTECYCLLYAYVCVHLFAFSCYVVFLVLWGFLTPRIVAVALAVRNRTSTTNSLDLLLGIKRMGEQTDEVPGLFSNNECSCCKAKWDEFTVNNVTELQLKIRVW